MLSLDECTPLPMLPAFDNMTAPMAPKRGRRDSEELNRRVRANLNTLSIPDLRSGVSAPLQLQPQGRTGVAGMSFEKILLGGAMRNKAAAEKKTQLHAPRPLPKTVTPTFRGSPSRKHVSPPVFKSNPLKAPLGNANPSLMSLRMAAMVKGSADAKAQLKFGGFDKSFQAPGRARSSPYRPARAQPMRNRSFNAICA